MDAWGGGSECNETRCLISSSELAHLEVWCGMDLDKMGVGLGGFQSCPFLSCLQLFRGWMWELGPPCSQTPPLLAWAPGAQSQGVSGVSCVPVELPCLWVIRSTGPPPPAHPMRDGAGGGYHRTLAQLSLLRPRAGIPFLHCWYSCEPTGKPEKERLAPDAFLHLLLPFPAKEPRKPEARPLRVCGPLAG